MSGARVGTCRAPAGTTSDASTSTAIATRAFMALPPRCAYAPRRSSTRRHARSLNGYGPEVHVAAVHQQLLLRQEFAACQVLHLPAVRHDASAGLQLLVQLRQQRGVQARLEKERDDGRRADVGLEQILSEKAHSAGDTRRPGVGFRLADALGIDVDADAARAIHLRGRDRDAPVA